MKVVKSELVLVSPQGERSYVVEEHTADDGTIWRVEGLRDNADFEAQMLKRVPGIELQMTVAMELKLSADNYRKAEEKISAYIGILDLKIDVGLTDAEIAARVEHG